MPSSPESDPTIFSLAEANAALPKVMPLIEQLQELQRAIFDSQQQREKLTNTLARGNGHSQTALQDQLHAETARQDQLVAEAETTFYELSACGAMLKDLESGLLDFYGERAGETILLCWRLGEPMCIQHWHTLNGGFAGRQPVDELVRST